MVKKKKKKDLNLLRWNSTDTNSKTLNKIRQCYSDI